MEEEEEGATVVIAEEEEEEAMVAEEVMEKGWSKSDIDAYLVNLVNFRLRVRRLRRGRRRRRVEIGNR